MVDRSDLWDDRVEAVRTGGASLIRGECSVEGEDQGAGEGLELERDVE